LTKIKATNTSTIWSRLRLLLAAAPPDPPELPLLTSQCRLGHILLAAAAVLLLQKNGHDSFWTLVLFRLPEPIHIEENPVYPPLIKRTCRNKKKWQKKKTKVRQRFLLFMIVAAVAVAVADVAAAVSFCVLPAVSDWFNYNFSLLLHNQLFSWLLSCFIVEQDWKKFIAIARRRRRQTTHATINNFLSQKQVHSCPTPQLQLIKAE